MTNNFNNRYPLTETKEGANEHYTIKDEALFCDDNFVVGCAGCEVKFYPAGVLVCEKGFDPKTEQETHAYTFYNNLGDQILNTQDFEVCTDENEEDYNSKIGEVEVAVYDEMLIAKHSFDYAKYIEAIDYATGYGFCGDRLRDVYDSVINLDKQETI